MFIKRADAEFIGATDGAKATNLFEEILKNNSHEIALASTLDEADLRKQNYNMLRRISEKSSNILSFATRAISAHESFGPNRNGDAFEREQLVKHHKTFFLRPHLLDHKMEIPFIRGIIADSRWNKKGDFVETLIFVDRDSFPKYAANIEKGLINSFSMGVQVDEAECSICGNKAYSPDSLCTHAANFKGLQIQGKKVFEYNRGLNFIEQSAVVSPADPDSHTLYILANVQERQHPDMSRLKKIAEILHSYSEDEKRNKMAEYGLFESYANLIADRVASDLGIDFRMMNRG